MIGAVEIDGWQDLFHALTPLREGWSFRGQQDHRWPLTTSLDRSGSVDRRGDEAKMLLRFQRRAKIRLPIALIPDDEDLLAWWGIMQHYGAPTRLLDLSASPYVALFFAFEMPAATPEDRERRRTLWAFNIPSTQQRSAEILAKVWNVPFAEVFNSLMWDQREVVEDFYRRDDVSTVVVAEPWQFDDRQQAQQTQFLVPGSVMHSLEANLQALEPCDHLMKRFDIAGRLRCEILAELARMNVTAASLFPGLDGFGRSMRSHLHAEAQ